MPSGRNMNIIVQSPKQTKNTKIRTPTFKETEWTYFSLFSHMSTTKIPRQTSLSKTTMRCYLTLIRRAIIKKTRNNKYSKEVEKREPFSTVAKRVDLKSAHFKKKNCNCEVIEVNYTYEVIISQYIHVYQIITFIYLKIIKYYIILKFYL